MFRLSMKVGMLVVWLCGSPLYAQRSAPIRCTADLLQFDNDMFPGAQVFTGNVEFSHEGSVGYADTVVYYENANMLEAFGKEVIIHINDSVHLYGRFLRYDGKKRTAVLDGDVMLFDNHSVLYTDLLTFYRSEQYAFYDCGGRIENDSAVLTSQYGYYYTATADAFFRREVQVRHPEFSLDADTLRYNTRNETVYFTGPTQMCSDSNTIYCEKGWYVTKREQSAFFGPTRIHARKSFLTADTLYYDHMKDSGTAHSNVLLTDTASKHYVTGDYLEYAGKSGYAFVTGNALAAYLHDSDTLYLHADTFWVDLDTDRHVTAALCHANVRFFHPQYQGRCNRLHYNAIDSIVEMFGGPLIWNYSNQVVADTMRFFLQNNDLRKIDLLNNAFICQDIWDEDCFNQIKGDCMYLHFKEGEPDFMWVFPNAACIYYIEDKDSALIGVHRAAAEKMKVLFDNREISGITFYRKIQGIFGPEGNDDERYLPMFRWLDEFRPKNRSAILLPDMYIPSVGIEEHKDDEDEE